MIKENNLHNHFFIIGIDLGIKTGAVCFRNPETNQFEWRSYNPKKGKYWDWLIDCLRYTQSLVNVGICNYVFGLETTNHYLNNKTYKSLIITEYEVRKRLSQTYLNQKAIILTKSQILTYTSKQVKTNEYQTDFVNLTDHERDAYVCYKLAEKDYYNLSLSKWLAKVRKEIIKQQSFLCNDQMTE